MALNSNITTNLIYSANLNDVVLLQQYDNTVTSTITKDITINSAYIKITNLQGDKDKINLTVSFYNEKDGAKISIDKFYSFIPNIDTSATNFFKQGYEYLKTLDEYKNATDLLDEGQTA